MKYLVSFIIVQKVYIWKIKKCVKIIEKKKINEYFF